MQIACSRMLSSIRRNCCSFAVSARAISLRSEISATEAINLTLSGPSGAKTDLDGKPIRFFAHRGDRGRPPSERWAGARRKALRCSR